MAEAIDAYDPLAQRCGTCRYHDVLAFYEFYGKSARGLGGLGFCRRYPPLPDFTRLIEMDRTNPDADRMDYVLFVIWPETGEDDWCGEYVAADLDNLLVRQQLGFEETAPGDPPS